MYPKISQRISNIGKFHENPTLQRENRADFLQSSSPDAHKDIFASQYDVDSPRVHRPHSWVKSAQEW